MPEVVTKSADHTVEESPPDGTSTNRPRRRSVAYWTRWLHVYTSMISLLLVLFFGITGVTLNHPSWVFGNNASLDTATGTLPAGFVNNGEVDFLAVTEFVRAENNVRGTVDDYRADASEGNVSFKGPGYAADLRFSVETGSYDLAVEREGIVAVMNDLHKGRDTNTSWSWTIDVAGGVLVGVAATGLAVQLFMRKRRARAITLSAIAAAVSLALMYFTLA